MSILKEILTELTFHTLYYLHLLCQHLELVTFFLYLTLSKIRSDFIFNWNKVVNPETPWSPPAVELDFLLYDICQLLVYGPFIFTVLWTIYVILLLIYQWWKNE